MTRRTIAYWTIEFVCLTLIAVVLSTASATAKWWIIIPAAIIIIVKIAEYSYNARLRVRMIEYQLQILVTLLPNNGSNIRCTYHRPLHRKLRNQTELLQAFDYIPAGGGGGRRFPIEKGIIGKTYQTKAARVENFVSDEEYRQRMVAEYNYTNAEVMQRTADRRSYLCYPIVDENHNVLGLLYVDSDTPSTFTLDATNPKRQAISKAGDVIRGNILASS